jgi:TPR repeat protein
VPQDYSEAVECFEEAAGKYQNAAQLNLGTCYDLGHGVQQDYAKAARLYTAVAHRGEPIAQARLGLSYLYGRGVPKDGIEAYKWFKLAAEQGNKDKGVAPAEKLASLGFVQTRLLPILLLDQDKGVAWAEKLAHLESTLSPDELQEGDRRYREFKASR